MLHTQRRLNPATLELVSKTVGLHKLKNHREVPINTGFGWVPREGQPHTFELLLPKCIVREGLFYSTADELCNWKASNFDSEIVVQTDSALVRLTLVQTESGEKYLRSPRFTGALKNLTVIS